MIKNILTFCTFFLFSYLSWSQNVKGDVEIKIIDSFIVEEQMITVVLINHSEVTYWFPLDVSEFTLNAALSGSYESSVFTVQQRLRGNKVEIPLIMEASANPEELLTIWKGKLDKKKVDGYVILRPKHIYTIQIPFRIHFSMLPAKFDLSSLEEIGELYYSLNYTLLPRVLEKFMSTTELKEIENRGYYLYTHDLISNEVPVFLKENSSL